ncbi:MAG: YicC family protein [Bacteroidales bacterium]|nr:YicC family protein [Candidatus Cacconaster caballi]
MTGYGKAECSLGPDKYIFEIRSVNGKTADISIKTGIVPREKEMEVRQYIAGVLNRGNIDLFATVEHAEAVSARTINMDVAVNYAEQLRQLAARAGVKLADEDMVPSVLRMPDIFEQKTQDSFSEEQWQILYGALKEAVASLDGFRTKEGESLRRDVLSQVDKIESYVLEVEKYEKERIDAVRQRIDARMAELSFQPDKERIEQEMIFYIEKLDINEEKVRLRQHCKYFRETLESEPYPGRKLGFIAQEMGREINTMGSKANHHEIQKWVVRMKDELEKIKEQSLNIL